MRVLVATDGSDNSMKAIQKAVEMAKNEKSKVTVMAVAYYAKEDLDEMPPAIQERLEAQAVNALEKAKAVFSSNGIEVETVLEAGFVPANNIVKRAKEGKYDAILLGSTGSSTLKEVLIGSTASKVCAHASCSVTVVR